MANNQQRPSETDEAKWRELLQAAFRLIDDSCEDAQTGRVSIDNEIAAVNLRKMMDVFVELGIEGHDSFNDATNNLFAGRRVQAQANAGGECDGVGTPLSFPPTGHPMQKLGGWCADHLDEDDYKSVEPYLLAVNALLYRTAAPQPTAREPV